MKQKPFSSRLIFLATILLTILLLPISALAGTITQLTSTPSYEEGLDISGDKIVWYENRSGNTDIYMFDTTTGVETRITSDPAIQRKPAIDGDRIVWEDFRYGHFQESDIVMYDITTGITTRVTSDVYSQEEPDIYGDRIVYFDLRFGSSNIFMYDITTELETPIAPTIYPAEEKNKSFPSIDGDKIVYHSYISVVRTFPFYHTDDNSDVYMYNITTGVETNLTPEPRPGLYNSYTWTRQWRAEISGDNIVWRDERDIRNEYDIYMYNITTGEETNVTSEYISGNKSFPSIDGDKIVWSSYPYHNCEKSGVRTYDITTGEITNITNIYGDRDPKVSGDKIVWLSYSYESGNWNVFYYDPNGPVVADAGLDQSIDLVGSVVQLDGTDSYSDNDGPITYSWEIVCKPGNYSSAVLTNADTSTPTFIADINGTYEVLLTVTDATGAFSIDYVLISFNNVTPIAVPLDSYVVVPLYATVELDGVTKSTDANLDPLTFSWSFTSTPIDSWAFFTEPSEGLAEFTADKLGSYIVSMTANDGLVDSPPAMIEVLVIPHDEMASNTLMEVVDGINALKKLNPDVFRNKGSAKKLNKEVDKVLKELGKEKYKNALKKIDKLIQRLDGCALRGIPDLKKVKDPVHGKSEKDEILDCADQVPLYDALIEARALIEELINPSPPPEPPPPPPCPFPSCIPPGGF